MAQQEGGWPLGLQQLNARIRVIRTTNSTGSLSFSSLYTGSPCSSFAASSDLDTESSGSFFHDRSNTLGNLIGITGNILEPTPGRSFRRSGQQEDNVRVKKQKRRKSKAWFSLCNKAQLSGEMMPKNAHSSLGHFLEVERRASNAQTAAGNVVSITYELNGVPEIQSVVEPASTLFSNGVVAPPPPPQADNDNEQRSLVFVGDAKRSKPLFGFNHVLLGLEEKHCLTLMFPCMGVQEQ